MSEDIEFYIAILELIDNRYGHQVMIDYLDMNYAGETALYFAKAVGYDYLGSHANSDNVKCFLGGVEDNEDVTLGKDPTIAIINTMSVENIIDTLRQSGKLNQIIAYMTSKILSTIDTI